MQEIIISTAISSAPGSGLRHNATGFYRGSWKYQIATRRVSFCHRSRQLLELQGTGDRFHIDVFKMINPVQRRDLIREFQHACIEQTGFTAEVRVLTPSGGNLWLQLTGIVNHRKWGDTVELIGTIEDISQRVKEDSISMAIVNHELSSPLTIIKLNVQLLLRMLSGRVDAQSLSILKSVDMHVNSVTGMVADYLTTTTGEQREIQYNFTVFSMAALIDTMIIEMRLLYPEHRFGKQQGTDVKVKADKLKIMQVLINLMTNAVNFSSEGSQITLGINLIGGEVVVSVADQGIGFQEGQEERLFQKYFKGDQYRPRKKHSKGLGLYLVKNIVTAHGGRVWAGRGKVKGAIFYFTLQQVNCPEK